jgi:hypothetical protein
MTLDASQTLRGYESVWQKSRDCSRNLVVESASLLENCPFVGTRKKSYHDRFSAFN